MKQDFGEMEIGPDRIDFPADKLVVSAGLLFFAGFCPMLRRNKELEKG
ncbi:hypothetical protein ACFFP0_22270 [Rhizobium puerariae]|uniref:Uncharacterized protein n=1 Tax=Rhizobium puerariae TaxID=1585791 RepID=A0ABV6ALT9_9HYPH